MLALEDYKTIVLISVSVAYIVDKFKRSLDGLLDGLSDSLLDKVRTHFIVTSPLGLKRLHGRERYVRVRTLFNKRSNKPLNER